MYVWKIYICFDSTRRRKAYKMDAHLLYEGSNQDFWTRRRKAFKCMLIYDRKLVEGGFLDKEEESF